MLRRRRRSDQRIAMCETRAYIDLDQGDSSAQGSKWSAYLSLLSKGAQMMTFVALSVAPCEASLNGGRSASRAIDQILHDYPQIRWLKRITALGPDDHLDIFEAPDFATASRVSSLLTTLESTVTDLWKAEDCPETFRALIHNPFIHD
jgi:hypothetical protein